MSISIARVEAGVRGSLGPFRAFGTSGPIEALAVLGASWGFPGPFGVKWRGAQTIDFGTKKQHFSLRAGVPKTH